MDSGMVVVLPSRTIQPPGGATLFRAQGHVSRRVQDVVLRGTSRDANVVPSPDSVGRRLGMGAMRESGLRCPWHHENQCRWHTLRRGHAPIAEEMHKSGEVELFIFYPNARPVQAEPPSQERLDALPTHPQARSKDDHGEPDNASIRRQCNLQAKGPMGGEGQAPGHHYCKCTGLERQAR